MSKRNTAKSNDFKGFGDPIAIFRAGKHTDSTGTPVEITDDDLNQMVANFGHDQIPYVVGHPKDNAPAYGWSSGLFVKDSVLYTDSENVASEFEDAVEAGRFRNRSVSIAKNDNNEWYVRHIGFLGGAAPAVKGLERMAFSDDDTALSFEFSEGELIEGVRSLGWAMSSIARMYRNMKNTLIESIGKEKADEQIPEYEIDSITRAAEKMRDLPANEVGHMYSSPEIQTIHNQSGVDMSKKPNDGDDPKSFTEAEVKAREDAAVQKAIAQVEHKNRCLAFAEKLEDEGRILPRQIDDVARFMESQSVDVVLDFSEGEGDNATTKQRSQFDFCEALFSELPAQYAGLKKEQCTDESDPGSRGDASAQQLADQANKFMEEQKAAGKSISFAEAMDHVTAEADDE